MTLEGLRTFVVVLEVPSAWRGDLLEVQANAYGKHKEDSKGMQELGQERFWVAVYRDDDQQAASFAIGFAHSNLNFASWPVKTIRESESKLIQLLFIGLAKRSISTNRWFQPTILMIGCSVRH